MDNPSATPEEFAAQVLARWQREGQGSQELLALFIALEVAKRDQEHGQED